MGANARKRVGAGAHLPKPWLFESAKRPDDRKNGGGKFPTSEHSPHFWVT